MRKQRNFFNSIIPTQPNIIYVLKLQVYGWIWIESANLHKFNFDYWEKQFSFRIYIYTVATNTSNLLDHFVYWTFPILMPIDYSFYIIRCNWAKSSVYAKERLDNVIAFWNCIPGNLKCKQKNIKKNFFLFILFFSFIGIANWN